MRGPLIFTAAVPHFFSIPAPLSQLICRPALVPPNDAVDLFLSQTNHGADFPMGMAFAPQAQDQGLGFFRVFCLLAGHYAALLIVICWEW